MLPCCALLKAGEDVEDVCRCTCKVEVSMKSSSLFGGTCEMDLVPYASLVRAGEGFVLANV